MNSLHVFFERLTLHYDPNERSRGMAQGSRWDGGARSMSHLDENLGSRRSVLRCKEFVEGRGGRKKEWCLVVQHIERPFPHIGSILILGR